MREAVAEVIALRAHDPRGLGRTISWSLAVHATAVIFLALAPKLGLVKVRTPDKVLVISLGGAAGPRESGPTTIGGRPVDQVAPEPKRPQAIKPATAKSDAMVVPTKTTPPKATKAPPKEQAKPPSPVVQPPATGRQIVPGNSRAETGVIGIGTGLQIGGPGIGGDAALSDFCCPAYLQEVVRRIRGNHWDERQPERGVVAVQFTIQRNGEVTGLQVAQRGPFLLERASLVPFRGLQLPPLPAEYTPPSITLRLTFEYK